MFCVRELQSREVILFGLHLKLTPASITFNESGTPTSAHFDDVYFSNANGLNESQYVFLDHNQLNVKWLSAQNTSFSILETGFGTGLNFLLTWQKFVQFLAQDETKTALQRLYFISTEKFPIPKQQLAQALSQWPQLSEFSAQLLVQYPLATSGCHRLSFANGKVVLDLWLGDLNDTLPSLHASPEGSIDAWYLDGFAPGKNPDMWQDNLFQQMARLSKQGATFATFTAAGIVKRGLRSHGFVVNKVQGFGTKRDMLAGYFSPVDVSGENDDAKLHSDLPYGKPFHSGPWQRTMAVTPSAPAKIAIIGGGLAGANLAYALSRKGLQAEVYFSDALPTTGASGNHQGGFYPMLTADHSLQSQFYCQAFGFAQRYYNALATQGASFAFDWCGVFFPAFSDVVKKRQANLMANDVWPTDLIHGITAEEATQRCGLDMPYDGLFIPSGGWVNPAELVYALLEKASAMGANLFAQHRLAQLHRSDKGWQCQWQTGTTSYADIVILAPGASVLDFPQLHDIPFRFSRGQVEHLPADQGFTAPNTVICHKGYFTPSSKNQFALGATFDKHSRSTVIRTEDTQQNVNTIAKALANCHWVNTLPAPVSSRAAIRCSLPDHRPVMGAVPDFSAQQVQYRDLYKALPLHRYPLPQNQQNLFVLTGLGSHGLCTSPLLAEALACQITGEPLPLEQALLATVNPNRFLIRHLIREQHKE